MKYIDGSIVKIGDVVCHKNRLENLTKDAYFTISNMMDDKVECFRDDIRLSFTLDTMEDCYLIRRESDIMLENVINTIELLKYKLPEDNEVLNRVIIDLENILHNK